MLTQTLPTTSIRQKEIVKNYLNLLDKHIHDLKTGQAENSLEIKEFAGLLPKEVLEFFHCWLLRKN